ncbi:MAG: hypothetical protein JRI25_08880 [Deltaproteobacteria bacterium]|nr:hypothetical protein [Deltaproteobacteria bacterium]
MPFSQAPVVSSFSTMFRIALAIALLASVEAAAASPAMVTTARGPVQLVTADEAHEAPPPPFLLEEGQSLTLGEGALVVVLFEGSATQVAGPTSVNHTSLKPPQQTTRAGVDVLDELLARRVSTAATGASRGVGDIRLVRPVPGSTVIAPVSIAWRCDGCSAQEVQIHDLLEGRTVWSGTGTDAVQYAGPALGPGAYAVVLDGRDYAFTVVEPEERVRAEQAVGAAREAAKEMVAGGADIAAHTSVVASVFLQAGLPTEALYAIDLAVEAHPDDASLAELRATFEARAGLAP